MNKVDQFCQTTLCVRPVPEPIRASLNPSIETSPVFQYGTKLTVPQEDHLIDNIVFHNSIPNIKRNTPFGVRYSIGHFFPSQKRVIDRQCDRYMHTLSFVCTHVNSCTNEITYTEPSETDKESKLLDYSFDADFTTLKVQMGLISRHNGNATFAICVKLYHPSNYCLIGYSDPFRSDCLITPRIPRPTHRAIGQKLLLMLEYKGANQTCPICSTAYQTDHSIDCPIYKGLKGGIHLSDRMNIFKSIPSTVINPGCHNSIAIQLPQEIWYPVKDQEQKRTGETNEEK